MSELKLPDSYKLFHVEYVKKVTVCIAAKSEDDVRLHVDASDLSDLVEFDDDSDAWAFGGASEIEGGDGEGPTAVVMGGRVLAPEEWRRRLAVSSLPDPMRRSLLKRKYADGRRIYSCTLDSMAWVTDGCSMLRVPAVGSVEDHPGFPAILRDWLAASRTTAELVERRRREAAHGGEVVDFKSVSVAAGYVDLVSELHPDATWFECSGENARAAMAVSGGEPVAVILPFYG